MRGVSLKAISTRCDSGLTALANWAEFPHSLPAMPRRTDNQIIEALKAAHGLIAVAARALGVDRRTIHNRASRSPAIRDALAEAREHIVELAEQRLFEKVDSGELPAVTFLLSRLARSKGYGDSLGINLNITPADLAKMTDEELDQFISRAGACLSRT